MKGSVDERSNSLIGQHECSVVVSGVGGGGGGGGAEKVGRKPGHNKTTRMNE